MTQGVQRQEIPASSRSDPSMLYFFLIFLLNSIPPMQGRKQVSNPENARFPNPFSCLVDLTWGAAENTTAGSTVAGAETMFPFFCHLCIDIFKR